MNYKDYLTKEQEEIIQFVADATKYDQWDVHTLKDGVSFDTAVGPLEIFIEFPIDRKGNARWSFYIQSENEIEDIVDIKDVPNNSRELLRNIFNSIYQSLDAFEKKHPSDYESFQLVKSMFDSGNI